MPPAKKKSTSRTSSKRGKPDINIQVRNLDKVINSKKKNKSFCSPGGCGGHFWIFGSALSIVLSFTQNSSIIWAIVHGAIGWFYVIFRAMQVWGWF